LRRLERVKQSGIGSSGLRSCWLYGCGSVVGGDVVMSVGLVVKAVRLQRGWNRRDRVAFQGF